MRFEVIIPTPNPRLLSGFYQTTLYSTQTFGSSLDALRALPEELNLIRGRATELYLIDKQGRRCSPNLL